MRGGGEMGGVEGKKLPCVSGCVCVCVSVCV